MRTLGFFEVVDVDVDGADLGSSGQKMDAKNTI